MRRIRLDDPDAGAPDVERPEPLTDERDRTSRGSQPVSDPTELKPIVEALIFASPEPITPKMLFKLLDERAEGGRRRGARGAQAPTTSGRRAAARRSRRRLSDRHRAGAARVGAPAVPRAHDAEAVRAGARDAGGDRLQAADHRAGDHRDPRRQHRAACCQHAARAAADQDRRPQERRRPSVPVRDDEGVPDPVRPART